MKVTELRDDVEGCAPVVLHPHLTVIQPADAAGRDWVLRSVGLIAQKRGLAVDAAVVGTEGLPSHDPVTAGVVAARDAALTAHEQAMTGLKLAHAEVNRAIDGQARIAAELEAVLHGDGPARDADSGASDDESEAHEELSRARRSLIEAELVANQPLLTREQIAKVEAAHHAVLEAQERSEARFGGARARKRLEGLRSDERRVLERLGFSTYADYMMSSSSRDMSAGRKSVETARTTVLAAQEQLDALPGASDRAGRRIELLERRDTVAPQIAALLGHEPAGPEAEDELRGLREPAGDDQESLAALATALGATGIDVGDAPYDRDDLVLRARHRSSESALKAAEVAVTEAGAVEQDALTALELAEAELNPATSAVEAAVASISAQDRESLVGDIDWALLNQLAGIRPVDGSEPAPLVLDEPFGVLRDDEVIGVLDRLSRFAPLAQIVVVSNRPVIADWATSAGADRAAVVQT